MDHSCEWLRAVAGVWRCFPVAADVQIKEELQRLGSECTRAHSTNARLIQQAWSMPAFSGLCLRVSKLGVKPESVAAQAITDAARDGVHLAEGQGVRSQGRQVTRFIPMKLCPCRAFREPIRDCARSNPFTHCTFFRTVARAGIQTFERKVEIAEMEERRYRKQLMTQSTQPAAQ